MKVSVLVWSFKKNFFSLPFGFRRQLQGQCASLLPSVFFLVVMEPSGICKELLVRTLLTKLATADGVEELHNVQHAAVQACAIAAHERRKTEKEAVASFEEQLRKARAQRYQRALKSPVASREATRGIVATAEGVKRCAFSSKREKWL